MKLIKFIILVLLIIVGVKTYNKCNSNDQSVWYNAGQSSKELVTDIVHHSKPIIKSIKEGFNNE